MPKSYPTQVDEAPHSNEAENAVIASVLIDPDVYTDVRGIVEAGDFFNPWAHEAFKAMDKLWPGIDHLTVSNALKGKVSASYLSEIEANVPTSVNACYYAKIVKEKAYQRKLIDTAGKISEIAYKGGDDIFLQAQLLLQDVEPQTNGDIIDSKSQADRIMEVFGKKTENKPIPFHFIDLQKMTSGAYRGNLITLGARPGVGKSQLLIEMGLSFRRRGYCVMVASAEMTQDEWSERELSILTGIPIKQIKIEGIPPDKLAKSVDIIASLKHYFLGEPVTLSRILNKARVLNKTTRIDVLIVDYAQLIADTVSKEHGGSLREKVGYISRSLKRLAKELNIVVIAAAQLNRDVEGRPDKRPRMSDLKESGDLEQDSDMILLLHRPSIYNSTDQPGITYVYVPKIRQIGEIGYIKLLWKEVQHENLAGF